MTVADTVVAAVVAAIPGAALWQQTEATPPFDDLLVFDAIVPPQPPQRYVVVWPDDGTRTTGPGRDQSPVCDVSSSELYRWQVTAVAPDRQMAAWLARRVKDHLTDARIEVEGLSSGLIRHVFSQQPQPDEKVLERPVVFVIDQYRLLAERVSLPAGS